MISSAKNYPMGRELEFWSGPLTLRKKVLDGREATTSERAGTTNKNGKCHYPWLQSLASHLKGGQRWTKLAGSFLYIWLHHLMSLKWDNFISQVSVSTWWHQIGNVLQSLVSLPPLPSLEICQVVKEHTGNWVCLWIWSFPAQTKDIWGENWPLEIGYWFQTRRGCGRVL